MEILDGQEFRFAGFHPVSGGIGLTFGAMSVAARVVGDLAMSALVALLDMPAQSRGPAGGDILQDAALLVRCDVTITTKEFVAVLSKDIGHFELGPSHRCDSPGREASRSSGLCVASTAVGEMWT